MTSVSALSTLFFLVSFWAITVHSTCVPIDEKDFERKAELVFTTLIYRHGDRTPAFQYPGDIYDISFWPDGWGQLTTIGIQQHYELGQWFRRRYSNFLSPTYNVNDIYVRSTDVDRTLMSAEANLAGLYPPKSDKIWNFGVLWRPIPVHTIDGSNDYIIGGEVPATCSSFKASYNAYLQSDEMKNFEHSIQPVYDYLTISTGNTVNSIIGVLLIRDALLIESIHKLPLPKWAKAVFPHNELFYKAALRYYYIESSTPFLAKFRTGFLLKEILDRFTSKVQKTLTPDRKCYMYSTHDSVVANFLNGLGVFDHKLVPYAAAIIVELKRYKNEYFVQLFYKNSKATPDPINIPGCGTACPLSKMYELYDEILPKNDFATECQIYE